ncbi:hypothetical protein PCC6912_07230 [Chlorogloeopsis fritschii PCC 6912]|uniref:Uncharacterized protein n=1 Tax=Chlorogloeopsis fritschii PCC 6912 TaxID=211165 RepID=A0A3S1A240_CHLFR|nr:hypothetical protein PCC6912_07230 [Chlorogloeopsis fritschii PCC 6912]
MYALTKKGRRQKAEGMSTKLLFTAERNKGIKFPMSKAQRLPRMEGSESPSEWNLLLSTS